MQVECPLCANQFPLEQIEAHASECTGPQEVKEVTQQPSTINLGQDKLPTETYSQYYARKGAEMVMSKPNHHSTQQVKEQKLMLDVPEHLR